MGRDLTWDAIVTVAARMRCRYENQSLTVKPMRRRSIPRWKCEEGLWVGDNWTDVFEPVRKRRLLLRRWRALQPIDEAAAKIGAFIRDRPDQH